MEPPIVCRVRQVDVGQTVNLRFDVSDFWIKVVDFLLGDEDKMLKVWKVGGLAECQVVTTSHSE